MEKFLRKIAGTQAFKPEDKLSEIIGKYDNDELELENLDQIYAAKNSDFSSFLDRIEKDKKD